jgi:hypothetical protein
MVRFTFMTVCNSVIICTVQLYAFDCYVQPLGPIKNLPPGYLFLCPLTDFETKGPGCFRIPDCPAYWSRDPIGTEKVNVGEAGSLGFPELAWHMEVVAGSWDSSVYHGIRRFHEAKHFDSDSLDVAI